MAVTTNLFYEPILWTRTQSAWRKGGAAVAARRKGEDSKCVVVHVWKHEHLADYVARLLLERCTLVELMAGEGPRLSYVSEFGGHLLEVVLDIAPAALRAALDEFVVFVVEDTNLVTVGAEPTDDLMAEIAASAEWVKAIEAQEPKQKSARKRRAKRA